MSTELPTRWYNIRADLPFDLPFPLFGGDGSPPTDGPTITRSLLAQNITRSRRLRIPAEVQAAYRLWRPTPLRRAHRLEAELGTPARIFYKYEGTSPTGSFKVNTALAQAAFFKKDGVERLVTQSNDGYWGAALAFACQLFGLDLQVYMMKGAMAEQPARGLMMQAFGARIVDGADSVAGAISQAIGAAVQGGETVKYAAGFFNDYVMMHNTVIGLEAEAQLAEAGADVDVVFACTSSGANFAGLTFPLMRRVFDDEADIRFVAVESAACPSMTRGRYVYEHADRAGLSPRFKMYTVGRHYRRPAGHLGSLIFHGLSPTVSALVNEGYVEPMAVKQTDAFAAGLRFARAEGILPAPECAHAVHAAIEHAERCRESGEAQTILIGISGHAQLDTRGYQAFIDGRLEDPVPSDDEITTWLPAAEEPAR